MTQATKSHLPEKTAPGSVVARQRRRLLLNSAFGLGGPALWSMLSADGFAGDDPAVKPVAAPNGKAKRVIYLFQSGGPAQHELFDYKPLLVDKHGQPLPEHVRGGQRLTGMSVHQASLPLAGSAFKFARQGKCGAWVSELLPHTAKMVDDLCIVRSLWTEAINHDPAITYLQTGSQNAGRPSLGAWVSYGLGSMNRNLPDFVVLVTKNKGDQPLYARLWGAGFMPSQHQGVKFAADRDAVPFLGNPPGVSTAGRRAALDALGELNRLQLQAELDPEIEARIAQYEMAFRMQSSVPEAVDIAREPKVVLESYGPDVNKPGTFASNCLLARRLAERGVRFIQLYHQGWDQHGNLPGAIQGQCRETDQPSAALIADLKRVGLWDDTLVIWGGEFGRTCYSQGKLLPGNYGRDHHPRCFTVWLAGAGVRGGHTHGHTDAYGYNIADDKGNPITPDKHKYTPGAVHVHDLQATILHLLGIDHERLTYKYQGRRYRLTDVHGHVVKDLLA